MCINITLAQTPTKSDYGFTSAYHINCTAIKSQDKTGTCWSFATASFLESELIRQGKGEHDLSEMFVVRNIYKEKARNYILRQGKANFSQGSLAHDLMSSAVKYGVVPESVFSGKENESKHDHGEMEAALKGMLDGLLKRKTLSPKWKTAFDCVLDTYLGEVPETFTYQGKSHTPASFAASLNIEVEDYVSITSFTHHPFYKSFILEIPDNFSNGTYLNVPLNELEIIVDHALKTGYSITWDGDVSEKGFSANNGIAIIPKDEKREDLFEKPGEELKITQELRQENFESYATTDDHLMHIVGSAKDKNGTKYYLIKNSWGEKGPHKGYLYMSQAYFLMKTVSILLHKEAIPKMIAEKIYN